VTGDERRALERGASALSEAGRAREAADLYGRLLRDEPDDVRAMCGLSRCLGRLGMAAEGLALAGRAAALAPDDDWPHRLRSAHLLLLGRPRPACEAALAALARDPSGFSSLLSLFHAQAALRDCRGSAETAARLVAQHPAEAESHNAAGRAAMLRREWAAAGAAFHEALRLAPQEAVYQSNLALSLERSGRRREAMLHFRRAVQTDPANPVVRRQFVQSVDRRLAVMGAGAALAVAGGVAIVLREREGPAAWTAVAALAATAAVATAAGRWWRLRQLDEAMRAYYRHERRGSRAVGAVARLTGSLWRERVLPVVLAVRVR
jgi:tetratricopeptide (TPR) repeat protein